MFIIQANNSKNNIVLRKFRQGFHLVGDRGQAKARFLSLDNFVKVST